MNSQRDLPALLLLGAGIALLIRYPALLRDGATWPERFALAFLLTGGAATLFPVMGWHPRHRALVAITQPRVAWTVFAIGLAACWWLA